MRIRLLLALLLASTALSAPALGQPKPDAPRPPAKPDPSVPDPGKAEPANGDPARAAAAKLLQQQAEARFAALMKRGVEACEHGDTDDGLEALRSAWVQKPEADVAAALGACEAKAGHWPEAAEHLAAALRVKEDGAERKRLEEMFLDARKRVGAVKVTVNVEGADVIVGNRIVGQSPLPGEVFVEAGKRTSITAKKAGHEEDEQSVLLGAKGTASLSFKLPIAGLGADDRYAYTRRTKVPFFVLGGAALVAGGVGAALYAAAGAKGSAADDLLAEIKAASSQKYACQPAATGCATVSALRTSRDQMMNVGTGVLIGGGVLLGAAVLTGVWAFSAPSSSSASLGPRAASLSLSPAVSPEGGGLWLRGGF